MLPDPRQSASHRVLGAHLTGPLQAGAADEPLEIDGRGIVTLPAGREPLVLVGPLESLSETGLRVEAVLDPAGARRVLPALELASWTEAGAFLPLLVPAVDPDTRFARAAVLRLRIRALGADGPGPLLAQDEARRRVAVTVLHGTLGRVLHTLTVEKARLRRGGRELLASRRLQFARDDALDRHGADLSVARFAETLQAADGAIVTKIRREPDAEYRRRLALYRRWLVPTRRALDEALNGPGPAGAPNTGPLGEMGLQDRFRVVEDDDPPALAIRLIGTPDGSGRDDLLAAVRDTRLIRPLPSGDAAHRKRLLPSSERERIRALRGELVARLAFTGQAATDPALSERLAGALVLAARCRDALGVAGPWPLERAQDSAGGSRYELGFGADVAAPTAAEARRLFAAASNPDRPPSGDPIAERVVQGARPVPPDDDRDSAWLLRACGLRTVERNGRMSLYVSTLMAGGLAIIAPDAVAAGTTAEVEGHFHAGGDVRADALLAQLLRVAANAWARQGHAAWTPLTRQAALAAWDDAVTDAAQPAATGVLRAAGLPTAGRPAPVVQSLVRLPAELLATLRLDAGLAQRTLDGEPSAIGELRALVAVLAAAGASSLLPLVTGAGEVLLIAGVISLPVAGANLSGQRAVGFRWYVVPLEAATGSVRPSGAQTVFTAPAAAGVTALVCLGTARQGLTDPYEHRAELPSGVTLDLLQYEYLMNVLDHVHAMGVEVNTWDLRRGHVDVDGDGTPDPLDPSAARTFRPFRRRRARGEAGASVTTMGDPR